ncbi:MAG TPA: DUF58 domain-containing protein [Flavobacteriia bacterium]|nr:DUF58 domain-containing protein [Flavobacteriia bacterium]
MKVSKIKNKSEAKSLDLFAKQVVEGFITGLHKSPFHGFSVEFAEHRLYNKGESTKHIDWKLFAKTDKLFVKRYEEETNLRCHIILDNSASMHYPKLKEQSFTSFNKIGFSAIASAVLLEILKKQRDAFGLSIYSDTYEYYAPEKGSERHRRMLLDTLDNLLHQESTSKTETYSILHEIAEKIHRRSLIFLFTDMFQSEKEEEALFEAIRHLKYNKHELILFHTFDKNTEITFNFDNKPKKFIDVETGESLNLFSEQVKENYEKLVKNYFNKLKMKCMQYQIDYVPVDINLGFDQILLSYLLKRKKIV